MRGNSLSSCVPYLIIGFVIGVVFVLGKFDTKVLGFLKIFKDINHFAHFLYYLTYVKLS
jgi:hypothetical protein